MEGSSKNMISRLWAKRKNEIPSKDEKPIVIVPGLPRSGTSMMMKMLAAGGVPILTDHQREADEDNPKGYYKFERVKRLKNGDQAWLGEAQGKAVKVISALLAYLPSQYRYKVIFIRREMGEILASQKQMLMRRGEPTDRVSDRGIAQSFSKHLAQVENWLAEQHNIEVLSIDYNQIMRNPQEPLALLDAFLDGNIEIDRMRKVIDPGLYRQRA
jgi:hypothetical protein